MSIFKHLYLRLRKRWRDLRTALTPERYKEQHALVAWKRESSPRMFYVFQGRRQRLMMEPLTFIRATGLIDVNLVLLRDYHQFFYHGGITSELQDVDAIRGRLETCRTEWPHVKQAFCLGSSMGGYAAILFGHYLKVDEVYAFAPQTLIDLQLLSQVTRRKDTWRFPEPHRDLALLLASHNGITRYKVFYCVGHAKDRAFAERIRHCPGVELCPQPGDHHTVVEAMNAEGRLHEVFAPGGRSA